jgi:outer membrane autotransporter protein
VGFTCGSYSWDGVTSDRAVAFDDFSDQLHAYYNGGTTQFFGELGYGLAWDGLNLEPFIGLSYLNLRTAAFHEGGGAAALTVKAATFTDTVTTLGMRPSMSVELGDFEANLRGMLGWRHTFGDVVPTAAVAFSGGNFFSVTGAPIARDAAALEAGLDFAPSDSMTAGLTYGGELSGKSTDQQARGTIRINF